ncbi:hypothetical protein [Marilutibacter alkalisoli]|uniref:Uncharacterized protein n=1 Tax=Marilutibacter alkalisoli TaxID=2591633 RepID=A0A514BV19_9GAMM|nr:hypothetical protein [Lysobacter alkalisoli]QDH71220.1 hypothetical protein FKV23_14805 [Lysobacter alkalisoli]
MHSVDTHRSSHRHAPHPLLDEVLRGAVAVGALLLVLLPEARGVHPQLGWLPLWLLGMPLVAWWAAYRFRLPGRSGEVAHCGPVRLRRRLPQARRRARPRAAVARARAVA